MGEGGEKERRLSIETGEEAGYQDKKEDGGDVKRRVTRREKGGQWTSDDEGNGDEGDSRGSFFV